MPLSKPAKPVESLAQIFSEVFVPRKFRVNRSRPIVFVCGGTEDNALRSQFLAKVPQLNPPILAILAERAYPHQLIEHNLLQFEAFLADAAECILIFVESVGSYAETGLFAAMKQVRQKTFIVNTSRGAKADSFLNKGPIKLIKKKSNFDEVHILLDGKVQQKDAEEILVSISGGVTKYKTALVFDGNKKFSDLDLRMQLAAVYLLVNLIRAGDIKLITGVLQALFKDIPQIRVEGLLSVLVGFSLICRSDEFYFDFKQIEPGQDLLISSIEYNAESVRARTLDWLKRNNFKVSVFLESQEAQ